MSVGKFVVVDIIASIINIELVSFIVKFFFNKNMNQMKSFYKKQVLAKGKPFSDLLNMTSIVVREDPQIRKTPRKRVKVGDLVYICMRSKSFYKGTYFVEPAIVENIKYDAGNNFGDSRVELFHLTTKAKGWKPFGFTTRKVFLNEIGTNPAEAVRNKF